MMNLNLAKVYKVFTQVMMNPQFKVFILPLLINHHHLGMINGFFSRWLKQIQVFGWTKKLGKTMDNDKSTNKKIRHFFLGKMFMKPESRWLVCSSFFHFQNGRWWWFRTPLLMVPNNPFVWGSGGVSLVNCGGHNWRTSKKANWSWPSVPRTVNWDPKNVVLGDFWRFFMVELALQDGRRYTALVQENKGKGGATWGGWSSGESRFSLQDLLTEQMWFIKTLLVWCAYQRFQAASSFVLFASYFLFDSLKRSGSWFRVLGHSTTIFLEHLFLIARSLRIPWFFSAVFSGYVTVQYIEDESEEEVVETDPFLSQ